MDLFQFSDYSGLLRTTATC